MHSPILCLHVIVRGKRILEVGCGIGLASLVLNRRRADMTATDRHPEVQVLLAINTALNGDKEIPFVRTAWADPKTELGEFNLIIGSDVLYETDHALQLFQNRSRVGTPAPLQGVQSAAMPGARAYRSGAPLRVPRCGNGYE